MIETFHNSYQLKRMLMTSLKHDMNINQWVYIKDSDSEIAAVEFVNNKGRILFPFNGGSMDEWYEVLFTHLDVFKYPIICSYSFEEVKDNEVRSLP